MSPSYRRSVCDQCYQRLAVHQILWLPVVTVQIFAPCNSLYELSEKQMIFVSRHLLTYNASKTDKIPFEKHCRINVQYENTKKEFSEHAGRLHACFQ